MTNNSKCPKQNFDIALPTSTNQFIHDRVFASLAGVHAQAILVIGFVCCYSRCIEDREREYALDYLDTNFMFGSISRIGCCFVVYF